MKLKSSCFSGLFVFISLLGLQGSLSQLNRSKSRVPPVSLASSAKVPSEHFTGLVCCS